jgi:hypothetical protein
MLNQKSKVMKTFKRLTVLMMVAGLLFSCTDDEFQAIKVSNPEPEIVNEPFEAVFTGNYKDGCEIGGTRYLRIEFIGTCIQFSNFTGYLDFPEGPGDAQGQIVTTNGEVLYVSCQHNVKVGREPNHPDHVISYWRGPFAILGGTGRFEGATGNGMTDDYNSCEDENSHHHWRGMITLIKGDTKKE